MKLVICGKGGSGKSTVSALIAREIAPRGETVLVVDTDESNFGLYRNPRRKDGSTEDNWWKELMEKAWTDSAHSALNFDLTPKLWLHALPALGKSAREAACPRAHELGIVHPCFPANVIHSCIVPGQAAIRPQLQSLRG
jgi:energy-coupling factor transporter ATP-binding protein EcfA2